MRKRFVNNEKKFIIDKLYRSLPLEEFETGEMFWRL